MVGRKQFLHNSNELQTCVRTVIVLYLEIARDALRRCHLVRSSILFCMLKQARFILSMRFLLNAMIPLV